ncbi:MAG: TonB-dependent receptor [Pyrinomonadaceae bacterium MAG19_C2-C3]|nr:TonB-dependent receptor [Pyrinomonadaceae bacterium MAG19_C2-C3]
MFISPAKICYSSTTSCARFLIACALMFISISLAPAQEITGTISGTVTDINGAAVSGATVTVTDTSKNSVVRTVTTDDSGAYSAPLIPAGVYEVAVESANFKRYVETGIKVDVNQRRTIDAALDAGNVSEVVTVEADALAVELGTPTVGNTISGTQARELPTNNRNWVQFLALQPGVSSNLDDQVFVGTTNPEGQANTINISVNGQRSSQNTFTVDGADTTDRGSNLTIQTYPSVDSIGEFKILRSLYPAESGSSGGGQVNVITRSGTNDFHGSFYEFVRNDKLNANTFLNNRNAPFGLDEDGKARRNPLRYNNFGYTIGGPIFLPRFGEGGPYIYDGRNRTFFFFSQEFRRVVSFPTLLASVPTQNIRNGIFPESVCVAFNTNGTCARRDTTIPTASISPTARAYVNEIYSGLAEPNAAFQLFTPARNVFNFRQEILKVDHRFTDKLSAFYRFQNDDIPTIEPNGLFSSGTGLPGVSDTQTNSPGRTHVIRATYAATPTLIVEGGYSYSYGAILSQLTGQLNRENSPTINVPLFFDDTTGRIPNITGNGFANISGFGPYDNFSTTKSVTASLTKVLGSHTIKGGVLLSRYRKNENALTATNQGQFAFDFTGYDAAAFPAGATTAEITRRQNQQRFANFLLGRAASFTQARFDLTADLRARNNEFYVQDEWRARKNLTLYYGLRYSRFTPPFDENNQLTNFDPSRFNLAEAFQVNAAGNRTGTGNPFNGIIVNDQAVPTGANPSQFGESVVTNNKNNFAPRVGLAFDPFGNGRTAIRTGYGIYFDQTLYGTYLQNIAINPPFQQTQTITTVNGTATTAASIVSLDNPLAGTVGGPSAATQTLRGIDVNFQTPYAQHWSLDVQQQINSKTLITAGYYGSKGTHLQGIVDLNLLPPGFALNSQCRNAAGVLGSCYPLIAAGQPNAGQPRAFISAGEELILDQLRPFRGYRNINIIQTRFNSNYHSAQFYFQRRFTAGSQFNAAYTFSKNLTDNQTDRSTAPQNPFDIRSEYGRAQLDRRHVFTANAIYELPFLRDQRGFVGKLLGGYQISSIAQLYTGLPLTVTTAGADPAGIGFLGASASGPRPDLIGDPNTGPGTFEQYFNTAAFANVPAGVFRVGNSGRGVVNGPPLRKIDLALLKNLRFTEGTNLQLRGEVFNIFNTTNFRTVDTGITSATFGRVLSTRDPRIIQLAAKFIF